MTPEAFFHEYAPTMADLALQTRDLVLSTVPDAVEHVDLGHKNVRYGHGTGMGTMVCYISAHKAHINLGFARGASLPDPDGLMEGTGKNLRHVKIRSANDLQKPAVRELVSAAFAV